MDTSFADTTKEGRERLLAAKTRQGQALELGWPATHPGETAGAHGSVAAARASAYPLVMMFVRAHLRIRQPR